MNMGSLKNYVYLLSNIILPRNYSKLPKANRFNPGLDRRLKIFKEEHPDLRSRKIDEISLDNLEQDINNSENLRQLYQRDINRINKKILFKQIERKYFHVKKLPNMLFWSEKEQIRYLSQTDPDLWTPEKLSECFPSTPEIVKKLLKSNWKPMNNDRIKEHDEAVCANWRSFKMGKLNFPDLVARHFKSFTSRDVIVSKREENLPEIIINQSSGEFTDIIRDYNGTKDVSSEDKQFNHLETDSTTKNYSYFKEKQFDYKSRIKKSSALKLQKEHFNLKECDEDIYTHSKEDNHYEVKTDQGILNEYTSGKSLERDIKDIEIKNLNSLASDNQITMKIKIPKEKWKKGNLYKINNCFYTDDGEFLYRI